MWLQELNAFFFFENSSNWSFYTNMIHSKNSTILNFFIWLKELDLFHDSKNWTFFCTAQRIELFSVSLKEVNFSPIDSKKWTLLNYHSKNWIFFSWLKELNHSFFWLWLTKLNYFFLNMTHRIEPLSLKFEHDSKMFFSRWLTFVPCIWLRTVFSNMTLRIEPFFLIWL